MPLVCQDCLTTKKKQFYFFQISKKFKGNSYKREIRQPSNGIHVDNWIEAIHLNLEDGVYCQNCELMINEMFLTPEEKELLLDNRRETLSFKETPIEDIVASIKTVSGKVSASVEQYSVPRKAAEFGDLDFPLTNELSSKLKKKGIERLYSHQAEAINKVRSGENVVITTGTASGKSLVYTIPALETLLKDADSTVLYLSPLKALTRDQLQSLDMFDDHVTNENSSFGYKTLHIGEKKIGVGVLEGGKSDSVKELTYQSARYWLTNVHYLHFILQGAVHFKRKKDYIRFFGNLKYVIVDELHAYNGVLGSKVAMLLRRLRSLCKALGTNVQFISCSASIGNPKELAEEITGLKGVKGFHLIERDGSPAYKREILLWNPGKLEQESENRTRRAPISEAIEILRTLAGTYKKLPKTIIFYGNRKATATGSFELNNAIKSKLGEVLESREDIPTELFSPFHAQLNAYKKQELMNKIKKGELVGIVSTSALEMGIDIGDLDLCIMIGYAGSKASFLQQAGRVGRKGPGLVIQIFQEDPLEQYYAANSIEFMERESEQVTIDIANANIVAEHMQYAAHELNGKLTSAHSLFKVSAARKAEGFETKMVEVTRGTWELSTQELKYNNLLSSSKVYDVISQQGTNREILFEGVDEKSLLRDYHYGAVFLYNQRTYKVNRILPSKNEIIAIPFKADYTTRAQINDSIYIVEEVQRDNSNKLLEIGRGKLEITRRLWGYKRVNLFGGGSSELIEENNMYPVKYFTEGIWIQFPEIQQYDGALHVVEHALASAIPTVVKCSLSDFSLLSSSNLKEFNSIPTIVCYETSGGGAGIMQTVSERLFHILKKALGILKACGCANGCPNCTHLLICERNNETLDKGGGIELIENILTTAEVKMEV